MTTMASIFNRIIRREIPAKVFYEDDDCIVIADHRPKDRVHLLIIPKTETPSFFEAPPEVLAMLDEKTKLVARRLGLENHFRIQINNGYGQEIPHLHYHFLSNEGSERVHFVEE